MSNPKTIKKTEDASDKFASYTLDQMREVAMYFGVPADAIPEDADKEKMIEILAAAKRHELDIAQTHKTINGKDFECPPGHMIIKVTPKSTASEFGNKTKECFFFAMQGQGIAGKRGEYVVIPDKYRSCWRDAVRHEYTMSGNPRLDANGDIVPAKLMKVEVPAEDVLEAYWNRDEEAEKRVEQELRDNSVKYLQEKKAAKALSNAMIQHFAS